MPLPVWVSVAWLGISKEKMIVKSVALVSAVGSLAKHCVAIGDWSALLPDTQPPNETLFPPPDGVILPAEYVVVRCPVVPPPELPYTPADPAVAAATVPDESSSGQYPSGDVDIIAA